MYKIAINIPTYKRPQMLGNLIRSIINCNVDRKLIMDVYIIVVDNDLHKSGEKVVRHYKNKPSKICQILYYNFPAKGLSNVRNELLTKSFLVNPDFIVFIDDDEYVSSNWLNELISTIVNNEADAARGPVIAEPVAPVSPSVSWMLRREKYPNNTKIKTWTAGNLAIRASSLRTFDIQFDKRFNETGSEDSYFGIQMAKKGASIFWAEHAIAFETIPEKRTKVAWFMRRYYRAAITFVYILKLEKQYFKMSRKILVSFFYIFVGLPSFLLLLSPFKHRYWGLLKLSEGMGGLAGLFNIQYKEYK